MTDWRNPSDYPTKRAPSEWRRECARRAGQKPPARRPTVTMRLPIDGEELRRMDADGYSILAIDLTRPKGEILECVARMVDNEQAVRQVRPEGRQRPEVWAVYLRVLDAHAAGATHQEVAEVLSSERHQDKPVTDDYARELLQAARAWMTRMSGAPPTGK